jgi:ribosomal protein S18 acetylase RimI-like enzyme
VSARIRPTVPSDAGWIGRWVSRHFATPQVVSRGVLHDSRDLLGLVAEGPRGQPAGLLLYRIEDGECEVVVLIAAEPRRGIGRALLEAAESPARRAGCRRMWLVTTNDNLGAQRFYEAAGWRRVAVHRGALRVSRRQKPEIPERGARGVPIEDEIEFERRLAEPSVGSSAT